MLLILTGQHKVFLYLTFPLIQSLPVRQGWIEDPVGRTTERGERERERRKFRKTVFLVSPPPRAARRPAGAAGESGAAAGEVQRIYALRHRRRRRGGKEGGETDGWRRCAAPFALLSASSSLALLLRRRCAKTCRGVRAGGRATVRMDGCTMCVSSWRRRRSSSRAALCPPPDGRRTRPVRPSARPLGQRKLAKFSTDAAADGAAAVPASSRVGPFSPSWPDVVV